MLPRRLVLFVPALLVVWLGLVGSAAAVFPPPIKDEGKFFSAEALEKANKKIKEIYSASKKDLVIETFAGVPEGKKVPEEANKKEEFFLDWSKARMRELGVNGIHVLICKSPQYLYIEVSPDTRRAFTGKDIGRTKEKFFGAFREKKFDEGLLEAITVVETTLKAGVK